MTVRRAGDQISGDFVRQVRVRARLTQDEFAERIGIRGGKGVISCWETGRSRCEGPTAELVLALFGGEERITGLQHATLSPAEQTFYEQLPDRDVYVRTRVTP